MLTTVRVNSQQLDKMITIWRTCNPI